MSHDSHEWNVNVCVRCGVHSMGYFCTMPCGMIMRRRKGSTSLLYTLATGLSVRLEDRRVLQHALSNLVDAMKSSDVTNLERATAEARAVLSDSLEIEDERPKPQKAGES